MKVYTFEGIYIGSFFSLYVGIVNCFLLIWVRSRAHASRHYRTHNDLSCFSTLRKEIFASSATNFLSNKKTFHRFLIFYNNARRPAPMMAETDRAALVADDSFVASYVLHVQASSG